MQMSGGVVVLFLLLLQAEAAVLHIREWDVLGPFPVRCHANHCQPPVHSAASLSYTWLRSLAYDV